MELKYILRSNAIKTNARFRGPTESSKYFNYVQESLHDITLLGRVLDRNDVQNQKGQSDYIYNNLATYFSGQGDHVYANVGSASKLIGLDGYIMDSVDFSTDDWVAYGGCINTSTTLESPGTNDPCGVQYTLPVQEGQVIYLRMFVKLVSGTADYFTIGSPDVNQGEGSSSAFKITPEGLYIGHYIYCKHKESISINVDVNRLAQTTYVGKVEISDASMSYVDVSDFHLQPINTSIKANLNVLEQEIRNIIDNM